MIDCKASVKIVNILQCFKRAPSEQRNHNYKLAITHLSPIVGVGNVNEGLILRYEILLVDDIDEEALVQSVLCGDKLLEVVDRDGAGALQEPPVLLLVGPTRLLVPLRLFTKKLKQN